MNLFEVFSLMEGGNMFPSSDPIKREEVDPTVDFIEKSLGISGLKSSLLGSSGKKALSGDLDIGMQYESNEQVKAFEKDCIRVFGPDNVRKQGKNVFVRVPIQNMQKDQRKDGNVQVDFMFSDIEYAKVYHHSPGEGESNFKGAHRNLALTAVASYLDRKESQDKDGFGRPIKTIRWKLSPIDGLFQVERESRKNAKGEWIKKQYDVPLSKSYKKPNDIANILFKGKAGPEYLNSLESVIEAVKKAYSPEIQEKIFKKMATNFMDSIRGETDRKHYPTEIKKYFPR